MIINTLQLFEPLFWTYLLACAVYGQLMFSLVVGGMVKEYHQGTLDYYDKKQARTAFILFALNAGCLLSVVILLGMRIAGLFI